MHAVRARKLFAVKLASLTLGLFLALFSLTSFAKVEHSTTAPVKTFRDWKKDEVYSWRRQIMSLQKELGRDVRYNDANNANEIKADIRHATWRLTVALHLRVRDYVALYVANSKNPERFEVAGRGLTSHEVGELIAAYSESLRSEGDHATFEREFSHPSTRHPPQANLAD